MRAIKSIDEVRELLVAEARRPSSADVLKIVADSGALLRGHFSLQGGDHSEFLLRFAQIGRNREAIAAVAQELLDELPGVTFDTVLCPESGGYFLGQAIAARTGALLAVTAINTLRQPTSQVRRGSIGASVLIVNDVVTTGASLEPLIGSVRARGGATIAGIATFAALRPQRFARFRNERGLVGAHLVSASWETFAPDACALCGGRESLLPAAEFN